MIRAASYDPYHVVGGELARAVLRLTEVRRIALLALVRQRLAGLAVGQTGLRARHRRVVTGSWQHLEIGPLSGEQK